jgi:8-oxo-dGTP pyrophosphatase MutT (NUDIX family)
VDPVDSLSIAEIEKRLASPASYRNTSVDRFRSLFKEPYRPAAVLIPLLRIQNQSWHILFTRRTDEVADHKGQVAFPGGRAEPSDATPQETALREVREEIGLHPEDVKILGVMGGIHTITNYRIIPVVSIIKWPYPIKLQPREVKRVFTIPLTWLANQNNYRVTYREVLFSDQLRPQTVEVVYYNPYDGEVLWGVSAEITLHLLETLRLKPV